jgi:hypothetical protein
VLLQLPLRTIVGVAPFEDCCVGAAPLENWCGATPLRTLF